ncbi:hypothetical protein AYO44_09895 [Planctomycetaceae bacterium SCGC AG-212-F19]|nr:hypothetical protein AYO44_09895 [Planctomycetaceae bacterium SCGC AG-212-F19]
MNRLLAKLPGALVLAIAGILLAWSASGSAQETESLLKFKVALTGDIDMSMKGKMTSDTHFGYTLQRRKNEVAVMCDGFGMKATQDGQPFFEAVLEPGKFFAKEKGEVVVDVTPEDANPKLKAMFKDSFGMPLCKFQVDAAGKELKKTITAGPGAKFLANNGVISNTRLFHPSFPEAKDTWTEVREVAAGGPSVAKGELTYEKPKDAKGRLVTVKVSGVLTAQGIALPGAPAGVTSTGRHSLKGEQVYDRTLKEWVSGKLTDEVAVEVFNKKEKVGSGKGTMTITLELLSPKP